MIRCLLLGHNMRPVMPGARMQRCERCGKFDT